MIIKNAGIYTENHQFETGNLVIREGRILGDVSAETAQPGEEVVDASGLLAIPGLVDIHFHGAMGHDFCDGNAKGLEKIAQYEAENGILAICPATMTLPTGKLNAAMDNAAAFHYSQELQDRIPSCISPKEPDRDPSVGKSNPTSDLVGIHLEGPFLSKEKPGAQDPEYIISADPALFFRLQARCGGLIKICDIAPEEPGALEFIRKMHEKVRISLAHTAADYDTAKSAFDLGAKHLTHLFNAMPGISHRAPGPIAAALDCGADVELIADGVHIHPAVVRLAFRLFGPDHVILISDSMEAAGLPDGEYELGGQKVRVQGRRAVLSEHPDVIAGSVTNLFECMKTAVCECGIPLEQAVRAASENPARAIGIDRDYGTLRPGAFGNLILLTKDLTPVTIVRKGQRVWQSSLF